jgi:hypothetical protein
LEADAELQKRRKTEDVVAAMNVAEDVRMESDGGAFLVGPCSGEDPEDGNEDYDDYNVYLSCGALVFCFIFPTRVYLSRVYF